jgi:formylglycine-generating enzyme required for sulfatase activity
MRAILAILLSATIVCAAPAQDGKEFTNSIGMKLVRVQAGSFIMGSAGAVPKLRADWLERDFDETPAHRVHISKTFYLGMYEVTNAQYERFDPEHKTHRKKRNATQKPDDPVVFVAWQDAVAFCDWLSKREGKTYRLPTEAEWEYACRAGTATMYHTGDKLTSDDANFYVGASSKPRQVGTYKPNAWGLFDMHGNVAEWCHDWYGPYEAGEQTDPVGRIEGYARVTRGWSWLKANLEPTRYCRSANRAGHLPEDTNAFTGFRVVMGEMPRTKPLPRVFQPYQLLVTGQPPVGGPDPKKPYYLTYTLDKKNPTIPKDSWGPIFSQHNHYSACCVCPNGDVLFCWYTCVSESGREMAQACSRLRAGSDKWDEACLFFDVPDVNDHAPVLFSDGKRVYHFCTQSLFGWDNSSNIVRWSDDNGVTWSHPKIMLTRDDPDRLSQPCSAFQAKDGTLVLACDGDVHVDERVMISKDRGQTWKVAKGDMRKALNGKYAIHPAIVPAGDGAILNFLRGPHPLPMLVSKDWGDSWDVRTTPFPGIGTGQKIAAMRLASGAILMCSIDNKKTVVDGGGTYAALSLDDGKTWAHVRKVEGVGGYMSVAQAPSGVIYLCGSRMGCAAFNEAWLREGPAVK